MNFKKTFLVICLIICLFVMVGICASTVNQTDFNSNFNKSNSKCASFAIQEENGTVFAFRQDAPLDEDGVIIHNDTLGDLEVIVQEINDPDAPFIHSIITEEGWIFSHGGDSSNVSDVLTIERLAREMLVSKKISSDSLSQIQKIFQKYNYSHFLIKAPDGRYGVVFSENYTLGTLNPGEFLVIPNEYVGFRNGNYSDYSEDPVDAIIDICSYEDSGSNRRNIYTYDYKVHDTPNGQKYGVDVYVTNDNGHNVGLNTSEIVTYCYFNDEFYPASAIPQNPDKLYVGNYTFENQLANPLFEVVRDLNKVLVNSTSPYAMN
ncbi:hypothetical protein [Methanobrevibacter sp.]|uniref:hypothetical protein n=1 Tax=Methanobrevibacter sp. TaxID=66852 RepID=UPI00386D2898